MIRYELVDKNQQTYIRTENDKNKYGIFLYDENIVLSEVLWFKTKKERQEELKRLK